MLKKKILTVIISLILAVIINGVPIENSNADSSKTENKEEANPKNTDSKNGSRTIAINVPPEVKDATPRPMLFIYSADKTTTTSTAPTETKERDTVAVKVPPAEKDSSPRPMLFVHSTHKTTETTDASSTTTVPITNNTVAPAKDSPTIALKVPPEEKDGTPRPMLFLYSNHKTTTTTSTTTTSTTSTPSTTTVAQTVATTESTGPKGNNTVIVAIKVPPGEEDGTPRPILFIYSNDNTSTVNPKITTSTDTTDRAVSTSTVAPSVSSNPPGTCTVALKVPSVENNGTPHPMLWINSDPSSPDDLIKRPVNFLRGYNCPKRNGFFRYPGICDVYIICKDYIPLTYICPEGLQFNANARKHALLCDDPSVAKCGNEPEVPKTTVTDAVVLKVPPIEKDGAPHPMLFINSLSSTARPNPDTSTGLPSNVLRGYSCPRRKGFFSYPGKCDVYIMCEDYTPLTFICPNGLQFNPQAQRPDLVCDDPSVVKCGIDEPNRETIRPTQRPIHQVTSPAPVGRQPWSNIISFRCPTPNGYFRFTEQCDEYVECRVYTPLRYICPDGLHFDPDARWTEYPCVDPSLARCRRP